MKKALSLFSLSFISFLCYSQCNNYFLMLRIEGISDDQMITFVIYDYNDKTKQLHSTNTTKCEQKNNCYLIPLAPKKYQKIQLIYTYYEKESVLITDTMIYNLTHNKSCLYSEKKIILKK